MYHFSHLTSSFVRFWITQKAGDTVRPLKCKHMGTLPWNIGLKMQLHFLGWSLLVSFQSSSPNIPSWTSPLRFFCFHSTLTRSKIIIAHRHINPDRVGHCEDAQNCVLWLHSPDGDFDGRLKRHVLHIELVRVLIVDVYVHSFCYAVQVLCRGWIRLGNSRSITLAELLLNSHWREKKLYDFDLSRTINLSAKHSLQYLSKPFI